MKNRFFFQHNGLISTNEVSNRRKWSPLPWVESHGLVCQCLIGEVTEVAILRAKLQLTSDTNKLWFMCLDWFVTFTVGLNSERFTDCGAYVASIRYGSLPCLFREKKLHRNHRMVTRRDHMIPYSMKRKGCVGRKIIFS